MLVIAAVAACSSETAEPPFRVIEGVQQLTVVGAAAGAPLGLLDPDGRELLTLVTDARGQAHFAYIPAEPITIRTGIDGDLPSYDGRTLQPGTGYTIIDRSRSPVRVVRDLKVLGVDDVPDSAHYERQTLLQGFNYIEMRDGITLGATVWFPDLSLCGEGPWPTVVEYSGYSPSNPWSPDPGTMIAVQLLCYAAVGVNMRGTGCSGGVFDVFNPAQHADGYDIIEAVSRQWFVLGGKVGMVGLSYPGISQIYVAYTNPPHLAAITPLSVIDDPWRQAWPGGIYNSGFTRQWVEARDRYAQAGGADWVNRLIDEGDEACAANQHLRSQNVNFESFIKALPTFPPDAEERRLASLVSRIDVPVFLTGAWQDEQTGSRFATMLDDFTAAPLRRFTMFNGRHPDGYTPLTLSRWAEFLDFYVAGRIPRINPALRFLQAELLGAIFGANGLSFEPDRFTDYENYEAALAAYEAEPEVRVLFENGFGGAVTEAPVHRFERSFDAWPPAEARARNWSLGPDGRLLDGAPPAPTTLDAGVDHFRFDPEAGDLSTIQRDDLFRIDWRWLPAGPGFALGYISEPFSEDTLVVGNGGFATLWFASDSTDAHVEVSILEVRPDGTEFLISTGVLAVRHRLGIDTARSGPFLVEYLYDKAHIDYPAAGAFVEIKVPILPFAHAFRAGTRVRLVIDTPGRDHGFWEYANPTVPVDAIHSVARTPAMPSSLTLPILTGTAIPAPPPPCYSLRGIVCRDFWPLPNTAVTR